MVTGKLTSVFNGKEQVAEIEDCDICFVAGITKTDDDGDSCNAQLQCMVLGGNGIDSGTTISSLASAVISMLDTLSEGSASRRSYYIQHFLKKAIAAALKGRKD